MEKLPKTCVKVPAAVDILRLVGLVVLDVLALCVSQALHGTVHQRISAGFPVRILKTLGWLQRSGYEKVQKLFFFGDPRENYLFHPSSATT